MINIKTARTRHQKFLNMIGVWIISIALGNILLQFFLRFLLTDLFRVIWVSAVVYLVLIPLNIWLLKKIRELIPTKFRDRILLVGLSLLVTGIFYFVFPIKITGNLLLLADAPLWLYRLSRLTNILSFMLTGGYSFFMILISLRQKTAEMRGWWIAAVSIFTLLLLVGLLIYQDYGISSDEPNERTNGLVSAHYVASYIEEILLEPDPYIPRLSTYRYRYYGVAFQLPLALIENNALIRGQDIWHFRHLANFLVFYSGVLAFFHLTAEFFDDARYGLVGVVLLVISPRIFAHAFFNPKDTVFLAAFTIALYFCTRFWRLRSFWSAALAGIASAFAANIRIIALALVFISLGILLLDIFSKKREGGWKQTLLYLAITVIFLVLFWPASWQSPLTTLGKTISLFSDYTYWNNRVMYLGEFILGAQAPWHYLPVWMGITTPLPYILFFLIGLLCMGFYYSRKGEKLFSDHNSRMPVIFLGIFLGPPLLAIILNSTLYNGWRHFQFVYPAFLIIALLGLRAVLHRIDFSSLYGLKNILLMLLVALSGVSILLAGAWMVRYHPHQAVFYNRIGHLLGRENFERDYWRISIKEGLEYLLGQVLSEDIAVCMESQFDDPEFLMILPEEMRSGLHIITDPAYFEACDFAVNTYRQPEFFECDDLFYEIKVEGLPILTITECAQP